jgi:hypothetical protein
VYEEGEQILTGEINQSTRSSSVNLGHIAEIGKRCYAGETDAGQVQIVTRQITFQNSSLISQLGQKKASGPNKGQRLTCKCHFAKSATTLPQGWLQKKASRTLPKGLSSQGISAGETRWLRDLVL